MEPINPLPDPKNRKAFEALEEYVHKYKSDRSLVIGITGAGGAGKTTFGGNIVKYYGPENCLSIDLDDYLISRDERGKLGLTGYNPAANKLELARENITNLVLGKTIEKPRYNHKTGKILRSETVHTRDLIVIEGVTTLYDELREVNDVSFSLTLLMPLRCKAELTGMLRKEDTPWQKLLLCSRR